MHDYPSTSTIGYYLLAVQPNLFGTWSLIREWGRIGHPSQMKIDLCDSREEASAVFDEKLRQKHVSPTTVINELKKGI
jgi:predicted DNA-binding WGR domain protein